MLTVKKKKKKMLVESVNQMGMDEHGVENR